MAINDNIKGAILMSLAMASFTINDAMVKLVTDDLTTGQIMFIRGAITSVLILLVAWRMKALRPLKTVLQPWFMLRTAGEIGASITYIHALSKIPLPNASAILQALPLAVTMGAALLLGEQVGWRRWSAITVGFVGVMIIIRPGAEGFTAASLLVVGSVITAATRDIATKKIGPEVPSLFISATTSVTITIVGAFLIEPFGGWNPVPLDDLGELAFGSVMLFAGYQTLIMAMRTGEISFIAPFRYTSLIWAIMLGLFLLGDIPDIWMLTGSAIVVSAGLYAFYRETVLQRRRLAEIENNLTVS
ncbi:DMT family transporter [Rhizobium sp. TH2]|uniref:DMT family transporter n=1 Tax=Rhizobium sp. TH2 TaxID=2775403 RepID=UPI002157869C|nr:DMT family transporter [Rhizobium sp. TH2]UVC11497.1 DMT family transporter [Rhizobium sp. TH2]